MNQALPFLHNGWIEEYWEKGYTVLRRVFQESELNELRQAFDRAYEEGMGHAKSWRHQNRFFWVNSHAEVGRFVSGCQWQAWADPVLDKARTDARMLAILKPLIGDHLKQIINQLHWKVPGTGYTWGMHQDVRSRQPAHCFRELATSYVQTGLAIDAHTVENGAMKVVPYSHTKGNLNLDGGRSYHDDTREEALTRAGMVRHSAIPLEMNPGDVALWGPYMIHGGGINTTSASLRRLYINGYVSADRCDRGQPVFHHGEPVPLTIPALIQYEDLYRRPEAHYPTDSASLVQRD